MNLRKPLIAGMLTMMLTQVGFADKTGTPLIEEQGFQKTASVLPAGARLVAGNAQKNEFYILGRMTNEPAQKAAGPKSLLKAEAYKGKTMASELKAKKVASKLKVKRVASKKPKVVA